VSSTPQPPKDPRTIDERIDAILMAIELNHADHEARIREHAERIAKLEDIQAQNADTMARLERIQEQLTPILVDHEVRLKQLERRG